MSCGFASAVVVGDGNKTIGWGNAADGELGFGAVWVLHRFFSLGLRNRIRNLLLAQRS
jgi:hypothetical protein